MRRVHREVGGDALVILFRRDEDGVAECLCLLFGFVPTSTSRAFLHGDRGRLRPGLFIVHEVEPTSNSNKGPLVLKFPCFLRTKNKQPRNGSSQRISNAGRPSQGLDAGLPLKAARACCPYRTEIQTSSRTQRGCMVATKIRSKIGVPLIYLLPRGQICESCAKRR